MDITLTMNGRTTINLWFMPEDESKTVAVIIKNGFSIRSFRHHRSRALFRTPKLAKDHMENPLVITEEGYKMITRFNMKDVQFLPTSGFRKLISFEELTLESNMYIPKQYGEIEKYEILININRPTTWCVWDHVVFSQDFINELSAYYTEDLAQFVPQIWNFRIEFVHAEFIFVTNDKNWVDI
ncbi:unnamed protein product, partial [Onchocerca flexuosa]|uniref:Phage protein n=1 Tax=Onchocerca flexuosa TaxID=387005 RepID=A0A183HT20_9BILA